MSEFSSYIASQRSRTEGTQWPFRSSLSHTLWSVDHPNCPSYTVITSWSSTWAHVAGVLVTDTRRHTDYRKHKTLLASVLIKGIWLLLRTFSRSWPSTFHLKKDRTSLCPIVWHNRNSVIFLALFATTLRINFIFGNVC